MKKSLILLMLASSTALADDAAVLKCRALPDGASRLACYDAMPLAATASPAPEAAAEQSFGLMPVAKKPREAPPGTIESTVVGDFDGWSPGTRIALANGHVWRVTEGSAFLPKLNNPKAEISRGVLGGFLLRVAGYNNTARVVRVQ